MLKKILFGLFCFASLNICFADELKPEEFKEILVGRKDLIRNELVKSNNNLCLAVLNAHNGQFQSLNNIIEMLRIENNDLKKELADCKANSKKAK